MKIKKIIITAWILEVGGYSIWIEVEKWIKVFQKLGYQIELIHGRDKRYKFISRENEKLLVLQAKLFKKEISYRQFIKNPLVDEFYKKTRALFEKKWKDEKYILVAENTFGPALNIPYSKGLFDTINKLQIPTIARIHDFYVNFYTETDAAVKDSIPELKNIFECDSEYIYKVFVNKSDFEKAQERKIKNIYLIPNSFDFKQGIKINHKNILNIKRKLNIKSSDLVFLQPTRIITRKRIEDVLFILSELKKKIDKGIKFIITGGFTEYNPETINYIDKIIKQAKQYDIPLFILKDLNLNYEIQDVYHIADFITLLSSEEGFGLPVLESCAYKKPLIVRRYPRFSIFENLREGEFNFIKTTNMKHPSQWPSTEQEDFINQILFWIKMPKKEKEKILDSNFLIAKQNFSIEHTKKQLEELLRKIQ